MILSVSYRRRNRKSTPLLSEYQRWCAVWWVMVAGILLILTGPVWAVIKKIDVFTPRDYGYVIGDLVKHEVRVSLAPPYQIDPDSLPSPGRIGRWLWLHPPTISASESNSANVYRIRLVYQLLSAPKQVEQLFVPEHTLYFTDGRQRLPLFIKAWGFSAGPLLKPDPDGIAYTHIQPAVPPPPIATVGFWIGLALSIAGLLVGLSLLAYMYWVIPFLSRSHGPFSRACRCVSRLHNNDSPDRYHMALKTIHRAFNETAGNTVFLETLADFFQAQPRFEHLRHDIESFFRESRTRFFDFTEADVPSEFGTLERLCRACRDAERNLT